MKAIIIDDEEDARIVLEQMLKKHCPDVQVIAKAHSIETGIAAIQKLAPDLVFLDVELQPGNGFDILERLPNTNFEVIFTTAYDHYTLKAIKFSALDYLLKPLDIDELKEAVEKAHKKSSSFSRITNLLLNLKEGKPKKICINCQDGIYYIDPEEIIRCEADANYTRFFLTENKTVTASKTLKDYDELLSEFNFIRVHHSHLVNLRHVKKYVKNEEGLLMSDGAVVGISTRKKAEVLQLLSNSL